MQSSFMYKPGGGYSNDCAVKAECSLTDTRQKVVLRGTCILECENAIFFRDFSTLVFYDEAS